MSFLEAVDRWFPPPELLRLGGLGIDISESSIKYIGFLPSYSGLSALTLDTWGEVEIDSGILLGGEVKDTAKLAAALAEVKKRTGATYARVSLPEERVYVFETEIASDLNEKEMRSQLEFRLEENVPLAPRDAHFDFQVTSAPNESGNCLVSVTVCARETVESYYEACRLAKLIPLSFEVESAAIARAVLPRGDKGARLLLDFGKTRTGLGIVDNGLLVYTSTIDVGGGDLSAALLKQMGQKTEAELTKIKNDIGLASSNTGLNPAEALLPVISSIKDEVQTRLQYWNEKNGQSRHIEEVILCGGSANLRGLATYFTETLGVDSGLANVWQNAFDPKLVAPAIDRRHSYGYASAIGLALASYH